MYTDLSFQITHPINLNGKIEISFLNVDMNTTNWKLDKDGAALSAEYCYLEY
jgi:hypothetical protein